MPGVSMDQARVSPLRPLVISVSLPARITITVLRIADRGHRALKPSPIDSTPRNTMTTPAMPMIGDGRRSEPLADRAQVHAGDRDDLGQHGQFLLRASTMRRRPACQAGTAPAAKPSADDDHHADRSASRVGK